MYMCVYVCARMCGPMCTMTYLCRSQENLRALVLSFCRVGPGDQTWVIRLSGNLLHPLGGLIVHFKWNSSLNKIS